MVKQGCILKQFKDFEQLFETVVFIKSTLYFKINLHKSDQFYSINTELVGNPVILGVLLSI